ncbi:hypothetical protein J3A83DRAFT_4186260 [Scleroderma citrinum]
MAPHCCPHSEAVPLVPQITHPINTTDSEPMTTCPGHPHCLPYHFCGFTSPIVDKPATVSFKAPETFNLTGISENDEDDEEPPIPPPIPPPITRAWGDVLMDTTRSVALNPLLTDTQMNSPGTSPNVHLFFMKNKGEERVCKHCSELQDKDPDWFPAGWHWKYQPCTVNANLCNHILNHHLNTYLNEAKKNGWQIFLEYMKNAFTNGYTFTTLHERLCQPGVTIQSLPPVTTTNSNHSQLSFPGTPLLTSLEAGLPLFSQAMLHQHLVRTKTCELVIKAWKQYFTILKQDLAIGHFTLDNACNNDTTMQKLSELLAECGIKFDHIDQCIMCLPHVLNICLKHIAEKYTDADFASISDTWVNVHGDVIDKDKYIKAFQCDPIVLGCDVVQIIQSSSLCHKGFITTIVTGNQMSWFTDEEGQTFKQALDVFFQAPTNKDITDRCLHEMDRQIIEDMKIVLEIGVNSLQVPHSAQQLMLHETLPVLSHTVTTIGTVIVQ